MDAPLDMVLCVSSHTSVDDDLYYNLSKDGEEPFSAFVPDENKCFICRTAQGDAATDSGPSAARYQFGNVSEVRRDNLPWACPEIR